MKKNLLKKTLLMLTLAVALSSCGNNEKALNEPKKTEEKTKKDTKDTQINVVSEDTDKKDNKKTEDKKDTSKTEKINDKKQEKQTEQKTATNSNTKKISNNTKPKITKPVTKPKSSSNNSNKKTKSAPQKKATTKQTAKKHKNTNTKTKNENKKHWIDGMDVEIKDNEGSLGNSGKYFYSISEMKNYTANYSNENFDKIERFYFWEIRKNGKKAYTVNWIYK